MSIRQLRAWVSALGDQLAQVAIDGEPAWMRADDVDELAAARPSTAVRLLPGFDAYVLGAGTENVHVVPPARRAAVSRQAGWISPVVVAGGFVSGTWELDGEVVRIGWFGEAGRVPRGALNNEVDRLSAILGRELRTEATVV